MGEPFLQRILGENVVQALSEFTSSGLRATALAEIIASRYGGAILDDKKIGKEVVLTLSESDAESFHKVISEASSGNIWDDINFWLDNSYSSVIVKEFFGVAEESHEAFVESNRHLCPIKVIAPDYGLYSYQADAKKNALAYLMSEEHPRCLVHMPTGSGKTRTAVKVAVDFYNDNKGLVVWLANTEELCEQAAQELEVCLKSHLEHESKIYRLFSENDCDLNAIGQGFLVASLQKLYQRSLSRQTSFLAMAKEISLVIFDEAHMALAETYNHLLEMLAPKYSDKKVLGLSATPGRSLDRIEEDRSLAAVFFGQKVSLKIAGYDNPVEYLVENGYLAKPEFIPIEHNGRVILSAEEERRIRAGFDVSDKLLSDLASDNLRTVKVVEVVKSEVNNGSKIIIFACTVDHAELIRDLLVISGISAEAVSSRTPGAKRLDVLDRYKREDSGLNVLVNCQVLTTGFDAPKTNVIIVARATKSVSLYSQMIGRGLRGTRSGGNRTARVYTVIDNNLTGFSSIYDGFFHWDDAWGVV